MGKGENNGMSKLTKKEVIEIFTLEVKEKPTKVGRRYGVSRVCISDIWSGRRWSSVTGYTNESLTINQMQQELVVDTTDIDYWI